MSEQISADFVRQVRLALEVLAGETSMSPTNELSALVAREYLLVGLDSDQSIGTLNAGDHIEWSGANVFASSPGISVSSGLNQLAGLITLPAGKIFLVQAVMWVGFLADSDVLQTEFRNNTDAVLFGNGASALPDTQFVSTGVRQTTHGSDGPSGIIDTSSGEKEIEQRIIFEVGANNVESARNSRLWITEVGA